MGKRKRFKVRWAEKRYLTVQVEADNQKEALQQVKRGIFITDSLQVSLPQQNDFVIVKEVKHA